MADVSKTDRRVLKTKKAIHQAFLTLFYSKDLDSITINEIAELADVNRGTVYLHYSDKYDLLDRLIEEHIGSMIHFCDPLGQTRLIDELLPLFEYMKRNELFFTAMFATSKAIVFRKRLTQIIAANVLTKLEHNRTSAEVANELNAQFMASAFVGVVEWWFERGLPRSPDDMANQLWLLFEKNEIVLPRQ